jgi:hypothetical protein
MQRFSTEKLEFARLALRLEPSWNSPLHRDRAQRRPANQPPEHDDGLGRSKSSSASFGNRRPCTCPTRYDRYQERSSDRGGRSIGDVQVWARAVNGPAGSSRESGRVRTNPAGMEHQSSLADEDASAGTRGEPFSWEHEAPAQGNLRPGSVGLAPSGNATANLSPSRSKNDLCADRSVSDVTP